MSYKVIQPIGLEERISVNRLHSDINNALADGVNTILVDLQDVTFVNSSTIGALVAMFKTVRAKGGTLSLCSLNDQVRLVLELSRINRMFHIYTDSRDFVQQMELASPSAR